MHIIRPEGASSNKKICMIAFFLWRIRECCVHLRGVQSPLPPPNSTWNDFLISTRVCVKICVIDTSHRAVLQTRGATTSRQFRALWKKDAQNLLERFPFFFSFKSRDSIFRINFILKEEKHQSRILYANRGLWRTTSIANYLVANVIKSVRSSDDVTHNTHQVQGHPVDGMPSNLQLTEQINNNGGILCWGHRMPLKLRDDTLTCFVFSFTCNRGNFERGKKKILIYGNGMNLCLLGGGTLRATVVNCVGSQFLSYSKDDV